MGTLCEKTGYLYYEDLLKDHIRKLGQELRDKLGLELAELSQQGSRFFKAVYINPARVHPMARELDVINEIGQ